VYAWDLTLNWTSTAPITLQSHTINYLWPTGSYFLIDESHSADGYHQAITAMDPGVGLMNVINASIVTLIFHVEENILYGWPAVCIDFTLKGDVGADGGEVIKIPTPPLELDNGRVCLEPVQPDIHLQSPGMVFDNSTGLYMITEIKKDVDITIEVHLSNATNVYGFYVDLQWDAKYKNSSIQKVTISPNFPIPYESLDMIVTPGDAKITVIRPCEKPGKCGTDILAFTIVLTTLPADWEVIPTPFNTTIKIASAFIISKVGDPLAVEYDYNYVGPFTGDPHIQINWYNIPLEYSCDLINAWTPKRPDITLDGVIDIEDLKALAVEYMETHAWGALSTVGDPTTVDIFDFVYIAKNFGDP